MKLGRRTVLKSIAALPAVAVVPRAGRAEAVEPTTAYVDVSVATLWVGPGRARPVDVPSLTNPADVPGWMATMTLAERRWLVGDLETQAAYGTPVRVLEETDGWSHVAVVGQPTPRNTYGYPGWLPTAQLTTCETYADLQPNKPFAQVVADIATLYDDPHEQRPFLDLPFNTRFPVLSRTPHGVHVAVPNGETKWFRTADVAVHAGAADIPRPSADDLVATAMRFCGDPYGTPYLWAGVSPWGFDCSGFTSTVYSAHGITIPRDAGPQYDAGVKVAREDLQTGDLIFFAHNLGTGSIHHVGMYVDDGTIIDAPTNTDTVEGGVERVPLAEHRYIEEYAGAARYL